MKLNNIGMSKLLGHIIGGALLLRLILLPFSYYARFNPVSEWAGNCCVGGALLFVITGIIGAMIKDARQEPLR